MADEGSRWRSTAVEGVLTATATADGDERGSFAELWRTAWTAPLIGEPFVQANLSRSKADVLRGLHLHRRQWDLWSVVAGEGTAAVVDTRPLLDRAAHGVVTRETFDLSPGSQLLIPPYVAHGFHARTELVLVYLVTREYDATDELGFAWDDPDAAVDWPASRPILSDRDASNPLLRDLVARLREDRSLDHGQPSSR